MADFKDRIIRAAKLDVKLYEEVEADTTAMRQATGVVILSSLTYFIGTRLLPESQTKADMGEMLRTIGFSTSPGLIRVLGIIPGLTGIVFLGASIWMLAAMVIAVRQALDYKNTLRAVGVCAIGWVIQALIFMLLFSILGGPKPL